MSSAPLPKRLVAGLVAELAEDAARQTRDTGAHYYVSTACLHGSHDYCAADVGLIGAKKPNTCKFCDAPCLCPCHDGTRVLP